MRTLLGVLVAAALPLGLLACQSDTSPANDKSQVEARSAGAENQNGREEQNPSAESENTNDQHDQKARSRGAAKKKASETAESAGESSADLTTVELSIKEMVCQGCSKAVQDSLQGIPGVSEVSASHQNDRAEVTYNPKEVQPDKFAKVLSTVEMNGENMGWKVEVVSKSTETSGK